MVAESDMPPPCKDFEALSQVTYTLSDPLFNINDE